MRSPNRMIRLCMSSCECNGYVHVKCLKDWISRDSSTNETKCPICRTRGTNYTLTECATPPPDIPMYTTPVQPSPPRAPPQAPPSSAPLPTIPEHYQSPRSSLDLQEPLRPTPNTNNVLITIAQSHDAGNDEFDILQAIQNEEQANQRRRLIAGIVICGLVMLIGIWSFSISSGN
jgi:hypothetical protein